MTRQQDELWPGEDSQGSGGSQPGDRQPTHRIASPSPASLIASARDSQPGDDQAGDDDQPGGWREAIGEAIDGLRFVSNSPGSLRDQIEYAIDGAYSNRVDGWWRNANIGFARFIAVPGLAICYLIGWAFFTRLSRALTCGPVFLLALMLANHVPVAAWLVPDWADFTTWWRE